MPSRRSARLASSQGSQASSSPPPPTQSSPPTNRKRKAEHGDSPSTKRGKKVEKEQKTIEESMDIDKEDKVGAKPQADKVEKPVQEDSETSSKSGQTNGHANGHSNGHANGLAKPEKELDQEAGANAVDPDAAQERKETETESTTQNKAEKPNLPEDSEAEAKATAEQEPQPTEPAPVTETNDAIEPNARDGQIPSSILEKGIVYFFYRGRVNIEDPKNVQDLQRTFMVLRPIPLGAKIGDGSIGDDKNCRLIAIPKKMLPRSNADKWTAFVETANTSFSDLKENFMKSNQYDTQTGSSKTPAATPAAEGVYAITTTGRESHLAYILTLPEELGDVQNDLGLRSKGSFVVSVKNPKAPGPSNADLGKDPGYSQEILNIFRSLRWAPLQPDMLNYEACQFLLIGEGEEGLEKAMEPQDGDENKGETAKEEIEKLESEDEKRVEHLHGEDAVFADLGTNAKDYPRLQTTW